MNKWTGILKKKYSRIILLGIFLLVFIVKDEIPFLWTSRSDLVSLCGKVSSANFYVRVERTTGRNSRDIRLTDLVFYLSEHNKKFIITREISMQTAYDKEYSNYQRKLNNSKQACVYIHKDDTAEYTPKVYSIIINNGHEIYSYNDIQEEHKYTALFLIALSLFMIIGPIVYYRYFDEDKINN